MHQKSKYFSNISDQGFPKDRQISENSRQALNGLREFSVIGTSLHTESSR